MTVTDSLASPLCAEEAPLRKFILRGEAFFVSEYHNTMRGHNKKFQKEDDIFLEQNFSISE